MLEGKVGCFSGRRILKEHDHMQETLELGVHLELRTLSGEP